MHSGGTSVCATQLRVRVNVGGVTCTQHWTVDRGMPWPSSRVLCCFNDLLSFIFLSLSLQTNRKPDRAAIDVEKRPRIPVACGTGVGTPPISEF